MFLNFAANASRREISMERHIRGVSVTVVMDAAPPTVTPQTTVEVVVREFFIRQGRRAVPVVDGDAVVGMVTLSDVKGLPPETRFDAPVSGIVPGCHTGVAPSGVLSP